MYMQRVSSGGFLLTHFAKRKPVISNGLKSWKGGIKNETYTFFPRFPDHKDPEYEPTKLLMVQRVGKFKGNPYWQKKILVGFGLHGKAGEIVILKNIPEIGGQLYKIKNLIKITPIRTPNGIPDEKELQCGRLNELTGEFTVSKTLLSDNDKLKLTEELQTDPTRLDSDTIKKYCRDKWNNPW